MRFDNKEVEFSIDFAKRMIEDKGSLSPMVVGITSDGKRIMTLVMFRSDAEKEAMVEAVCQAFRIADVTKIVFMAEGWALKVDNKDIKPGVPLPRPTTHPDRIEMLAINYLSATECVAVSMEMKREGAHVSLDEPSIKMNNDFQDNLFGRYFGKEMAR